MTPCKHRPLFGGGMKEFPVSGKWRHSRETRLCRFLAFFTAQARPAKKYWQKFIDLTVVLL